MIQHLDDGVILDIVRQDEAEKETTRQKILKNGEKYLSTMSYHSFSLNDIADEVGIQKASIFYHFSNKSDLVAEVLSNHRKKIEYLTGKLEKMSLDPLEQVNEFFKYFHYLASKGVCPLAVLSAEFNSLPENVVDQLKSNTQFIVDWLSGILEKGKSAQQFKFLEPSNEKAHFLFYSLEGMLLMSRTSQSGINWKLVKQLRRTLEPSFSLTNEIRNNPG